MIDDGYKHTLGVLQQMFAVQQQMVELLTRTKAYESRYELETLLGYVEGLFRRAPWQPGDKAVISHDIAAALTKSDGWYHHREWLVPGRGCLERRSVAQARRRVVVVTATA